MLRGRLMRLGDRTAGERTWRALSPGSALPSNCWSAGVMKSCVLQQAIAINDFVSLSVQKSGAALQEAQLARPPEKQCEK